jgi:cytidylate kinase
MKMKNVIHIYGASGSGTSTLGRKISEELGWIRMIISGYQPIPNIPRKGVRKNGLH